MNNKMTSYAQCGQDVFVCSLLPDIKGTFLDLGCFLPQKINNTYALELRGWTGISVDIQDLKEAWSGRTNPFIQGDCFTLDLKTLLSTHYKADVIDYLTLDMEKAGDRYRLLQRVIDTGKEFRIITIEHDAYLGEEYAREERDKQRQLLESRGYHLLCGNVSHPSHPELYFEDWWVNTKFFDITRYASWQYNNICCDDIFINNGISYELAEISADR